HRQAVHPRRIGTGGASRAACAADGGIAAARHRQGTLRLGGGNDRQSARAERRPAHRGEGRMIARAAVLLMLLLATIGSALAVVDARQQSRREFAELSRLVNERDELDIEFG